jgi:hypothetical protein
MPALITESRSVSHTPGCGPVSVRPLKTIQLPLSAAFSAPAALCGKGETTYSLFIIGFMCVTLSPSDGFVKHFFTRSLKNLNHYRKGDPSA